MDQRYNFADIDLQQGSIYSNTFSDIYAQPKLAFPESKHVFIDGNRLSQRFSQLPQNETFTIAEIGFGTGLNFINTAQAFIENNKNNGRLCYISCEKFPIEKSVLQEIQSDWPEAALREAFYAQYPQNHGGFHLLSFDHNIQLLLLIGDVRECLPELQATVDAWFLDGFAPSKTPELWNDALFKIIAEHSHSQTSLTTFSTARIVKNGLSDNGFSYHKATGFGQKREMIIANYQGQPTTKKSWANLPQPCKNLKEGSIAIIGAGIAGAATAHELAKSGLKVHLYHAPNESPAASEVPVAVPFFLPGKTSTPLRLFQYLAWYDAIRELNHIQQSNSSLIDNMPINLYFSEKEAAEKIKVCQELFDSASNNKENQVALDQLGAINTPLLCQTLINHPNIQLIEKNIEHITFSDGSWHFGGDLQYQQVIIATGYRQQLLPVHYQNRLRSLRGQANIYRMAAPFGREINCADFSMIPLKNQSDIYIGGTYQTHNECMKSSSADDLALGKSLQMHFPNQNFKKVFDFVGVRCASSDYLPMIGPLADPKSIFKKYQRWQFDSGIKINEAVDYLPGLYMHQGLGSKGTLTAFLGAKIIKSMLMGTPLPVPKSLLPYLIPARFLIRDIKRRQFSL